MEVDVGTVTHYYGHLSVAVLELTGELKLGDKIHITGHATNLIQRITSMEVDHHSVLWIKPGDHAAVKVVQPVHVHDRVYRVVEEEFEPAG